MRKWAETTAIYNRNHGRLKTCKTESGALADRQEQSC